MYARMDSSICVVCIHMFNNVYKSISPARSISIYNPISLHFAPSIFGVYPKSVHLTTRSGHVGANLLREKTSDRSKGADDTLMNMKGLTCYDGIG